MDPKSIRPMPHDQTGGAGRHGVELLPDILANIHGRLSCLDRIAFASVFRESRHAFKPEAPWLVLPGDTLLSATLLSLADRRAPTERVPSPAMRGHAFIGSSRGWLATADECGRMSLVNPVTGEQRVLPPITTIPFLKKHHWCSLFHLNQKPFVRGPPYYRGREPHPHEEFLLRSDELRTRLYRKVVLSDGGHGTAMLVTGWLFGVAAFTTVEDPVWRLAPSRDGVEDAIYHDGRFYSVTYSGAVEVWEHDAESGVYTSAAVAPTPVGAVWTRPGLCRRYLVAAPGGRLMVVLKTDTYNRSRRASSFTVHVLDGAQLMETDDIGDAALFVGANESLCVSTRVHPKLKAGCVYYTEDELSNASLWKDAPRYGDDGERGVAVFCLKDGTVENVEGQGRHRSWPPPAWFIPSIP